MVRLNWDRVRIENRIKQHGAEPYSEGIPDRLKTNQRCGRKKKCPHCGKMKLNLTAHIATKHTSTFVNKNISHTISLKPPPVLAPRRKTIAHKPTEAQGDKINSHSAIEVSEATVTDAEIAQYGKALSGLSAAQRKKFLLNLERVTFHFNINNSYLKYSTHPLTIPKEYYSFLDIHNIGAGHNMPIVFPDGSNATCYIYHGHTPQRGPYRQIKMRSPYSGKGVALLRVGDVVKVEIFRVRDLARIQITRAS